MQGILVSYHVAILSNHLNSGAFTALLAKRKLKISVEVTEFICLNLCVI